MQKTSKRLWRWRRRYDDCALGGILSTFSGFRQQTESVNWSHFLMFFMYGNIGARDI